MPFLTCSLDVRAVEFLLPAEFWLPAVCKGKGTQGGLSSRLFHLQKISQWYDSVYWRLKIVTLSETMTDISNIFTWGYIGYSFYSHQFHLDGCLQHLDGCLKPYPRSNDMWKRTPCKPSQSWPCVIIHNKYPSFFEFPSVIRSQCGLPS